MHPSCTIIEEFGMTLYSYHTHLVTSYGAGVLCNFHGLFCGLEQMCPKFKKRNCLKTSYYTNQFIETTLLAEKYKKPIKGLP